MGLLDSALPDDRRWICVGDAYEVTKKPRNLDWSSLEAVPFAAMDAIPQGGSYAPAFTMKEPGALSSGTYFERGDLLIAKITPSFENGKQALVDDLPTPFGYATTEVIPLRPRDSRQDRRLLFFYLLHPDVRQYIAARMEGSTGRQRVPEDVLLNLPFPDIAPGEQAKIAVVLELVRRAADVEATGIEATSRLKRAAMREIFARGVQGERQKETEIGLVPESWDVFPLGDHHSVGSGGTPSRSVPEYWSAGTIPWVKTTEVNYCVIRDTEERITQAGLENSAAKLLSSGTLLMAMYGQGVTRGRVAILGIEAACNQACAWISPSDGRVDARFLYHFLMHRYDDIRQLAHGGQQQNLNLDIVRGLPVAAPRDMETQQSIAAVLDTIDRKIEIHCGKRDLFDRLFKSLLHQLVSGEISVSDLDVSALPSPAEEAA